MVCNIFLLIFKVFKTTVIKNRYITFANNKDIYIDLILVSKKKK